MYGALLADQCNVGDVKLEKDGTPMLFWKEKWSPICGHYFWDNQHGANTFCKKLGYPSGKQERASAKYGEESIQIGRCNKDVDLTECTKKKSYCPAKDKVAIRITCEGLKSDTVSSSCGGISQITKDELHTILVIYFLHSFIISTTVNINLDMTKRIIIIITNFTHWRNNSYSNNRSTTYYCTYYDCRYV